MENKYLPCTPRGRISNIKSEINGSPLNRKPLAQITNIDLQNQSSPSFGFSANGSLLNHANHLSERRDVISSVVGYHIDTPSSSQNADSILTPVSTMTRLSASSRSKHKFCTNNNLLSSHPSHCSGSPSMVGYHLNTPSSSQNCDNISTPVSNGTRVIETPVTSNEQSTPKPFIPYNPFELGIEALQLPTVSPSLFKEVVSPSEKEDTDFSWAIDNIAILRPAPIDSPVHDMEIPQDPEYERKAQEAIDRFFSSALIVPSPWTNSSSRSLNLMSALFSSASPRNLQATSASPALELLTGDQNDGVRPSGSTEAAQNHFKVTSWSQTDLTLPPVLPKELEAALAPFCTFTQDQAYQSVEENDETSALNNTTLRRKLLFSDELAFATREFTSQNKVSSEKDPVRSIECGVFSPAYTEPLPLDEEEEVSPWGVSMIRPSSRVSLSHSRSSPALSPSPGSRKSQGSSIAMFSSNEVSPIAYIPPNDLRTLLSPLQCQQTPRRKFLESPKLSPIFNCSPSHRHLKTPPITLGKTTDITRSPLEYPRGKRGRNLNLEPQTSFSPFESTALGNENEGPALKSQNTEFTKEGATDSQGFALAIEKDISVNQRTPLVRDSHRLIFKTSPHFSSSPIKETDSNSSSHRLDLGKLDEHEGSMFSDSPPVSPISWKSEIERFSIDGSFKENEKTYGQCHKREDANNTQIAGTYSIDNSQDGVDKQDESISETFEHTGEISSNAISMDAEYPIAHEGSTLEEASCGQDTGYQTGTSLQMTNQSNCLTESIYLSKETKPAAYVGNSDAHTTSLAKESEKHLAELSMH